RHTRRDLEAAHSTWGERFRQENRTTVTRRQRTPERKLTIGYLSPDFRNHPAASFLEPVLRHHDRNRFTIHCYSQTIENDWRTDRFKTLADKWCTVEHLDDATLTDLIQSHGIDILIDSAGHLCGNRLGVFSRRAAPLQIGGIGYPGLRGLETIDYRISDPLIDPPTEETGSTEIPLRIAPCFCCWQPPENLPPVTPLPALHNGFITFGSLHTTARLNEPVINLWCELLRTIPDAQLLLCRTTLSASVIKRLSGYFSRNGISLSRIIFKTNIPPEGHLTVYNEIDIALDTLPWSGHTTSCESLIMGVPVLSLYGDRPAGRMVASVLTAAGLESWVARSPEEYIIRGSWNHRELSVLRLQLRDQVLNSRLCNTETYTATLEDALMKLC
ncbi:MAG: hypothetical protein JW863_00790, partial [Chitinispirillaceae bacterium]|nr:hypothetical protein [Chitinispirillaceae bacterium]